LSWVIGTVGLIGFYFAGKMKWWCWYINLGCQALWATYALVTGQPAFLATAAVYSVIFGLNAYKWTKERLLVKRMLAEDEKRILLSTVASPNEQRELMGFLPEGPLYDVNSLYPQEYVPEEESNLVSHARKELNRIGEDQDVIEWFVRVIDEYRSFGHSGGSHYATMPTLVKLLNFEPLTQLTNDPDEWFYHGEDVWGEVNGVWQNKRDSRMFSKDAGLTFWNVEDSQDKEGKLPMYCSQVVDSANVPQ
jgi:hypothetical protein